MSIAFSADSPLAHAFIIAVDASLCRVLPERPCQRLKKRTQYRYTSYLGEISPAPENIINRNFQAAAPNEKWLTDITEFQIPAGKIYLSPIIDCFDGMVVSWTIGTNPDAELVNTMLDAAIETVSDTSDRPVVHSDRGGHYRWLGWLSRMSEANLTRSMSRKACSPGGPFISVQLAELLVRYQIALDVGFYYENPDEEAVKAS